MSRQSNYARNQFFNKSMQRAQMIQKKKKDIQSIKYGNIVEPDPKVVTGESEDVQVEDLEVVESDE